MIIRNDEKSIPDFWTDEACYELVFHAIDLGQNGNPAGFILSKNLSVFIVDGEETQIWDYAGMRSWISDHNKEVERVWKLDVRGEYS